MNIRDEMSYDLNFREPRVIVTERLAIIENVKAIVMIGEESVTLRASKRFVTVRGGGFLIKEIYEGRLLIEGSIQGVEFFPLSGKD